MQPTGKHSAGSSVTNLRYSETKLKKSKRRPGTSGEFGDLYEKNILMLILYRALKNGYDFKLDTNVEDAGAFDDIVFTYKRNEIEERIYLQAKHKEDKNKRIKYENFLQSADNDYALYKYFVDYEKINDRKNQMQPKYFIIYTNIDLSCLEADDSGLRILLSGKNKKSQNKSGETVRKSLDDSLIFKKLTFSKSNPLQLFSTDKSKNGKKCRSFYQLSGANPDDKDEEARIIDILKNKFRIIDKNKENAQLPTSDYELESQLKGYIKSLIFAVDQPVQDALGNQVKEEIKQDHSGDLSQVKVDFIFEYSLSKIGQWKLRSKAEPLTEDNDFFKQAEEKFSEIHALYPTLLYENKLGGALKIQFNDAKYAELKKFILSDEKFWFISSQTPWLNSLILYQGLNEETLKQETGVNYSNHDHNLFFNFD